MRKDVRQLSAGRIALSTGTLYSSLKRLLEYGWISRVAESQDGQDGRGRKTYRLTPLGESILAAEIQRLELLIQAARPRQSQSIA